MSNCMIQPSSKSTTQIIVSQKVTDSRASTPTTLPITTTTNLLTTSSNSSNDSTKPQSISKAYNRFRMYKRMRGNIFGKSKPTNANTHGNDVVSSSNYNNNSNTGNDMSNSKIPNDDDENFFLEARLLDTIDEISIIGNRSTLNRVMWITLIILAFCLAIFQINDRISHYFSYTTSTEIDIVPSKNLSFPRVTICNDNYIKLSSAEELGLVEYYKQFMSPYVIGAVDQSKMVITIPKITNQTKLIEKLKFLSPGLEQALLCFWNGITCPDSFVRLEFTNLGQCLVINPREHNYYVTRPGATFGLMIILDANQSNYFIQPSPSAGFRILLHEPNEPPRMMELGFKVHLGQAVNIDVSVTNTTRLKPPYGTCTDDHNYNQVDCELKCLCDEIVKNCSCRPIYFKGNESICDYYEERSCAEVVIDQFYIKKSNGTYPCFCPPVCNEITYQASVTGAEYSKKFAVYLANNIGSPVSYVEQNHIFLSIYLSGMRYTKMMTVEGYSFMALLSDVGGALGLLLGSTILTLIEAFELVMDLGIYIYAKKDNFIKFYKQKTGFEKTNGIIKPFVRRIGRRIKSEEIIYPYIVNLD